MFATAPAPRNAASLNPEFAKAVAEGLTKEGQKTLPPTWFYDEVGSALFETITVLPEYGLTRAEGSLLAKVSGEIVDFSGGPSFVIELGSGTGTKTRHILEAITRANSVRYFPVDISCAALDGCVRSLDGINGVSIKPIASGYLKGVSSALAHRKAGEPAMLMFLGSTIGNFTRSEATSFLRCIQQRMRPGDYLLLGADLVKPRTQLLDAYDDPIGVTAAFNLNILARINRELDGDFNIRQFAHEARYNERRQRIEMHLRSLVAQRVRIGALGLNVSFDDGETIWTESSHKFRSGDIPRIGQRSGWTHIRQWVDDEWGFAETLFQKSAP